MKTLRIAHLYPELMNIYGDYGNILAMQYRAKQAGIDCLYDKITVGDVFDPDAYDFIFMGGGQDVEQGRLIEDLHRVKKSAIEAAVEANKVFLCICGGYQLFGHVFYTFDGEEIPGISILDVETRAKEKRLIGDTVYTVDFLGADSNRFIFGYENHSGQTYLGKNAMPLAKVVVGYGNNESEKLEGARYKNVFGTYSHGSLLPKNPALTDYLIQKAMESKGEIVSFSANYSDVEMSARHADSVRLQVKNFD